MKNVILGSKMGQTVRETVLWVNVPHSDAYGEGLPLPSLRAQRYSEGVASEAVSLLQSSWFVYGATTIVRHIYATAFPPFFSLSSASAGSTCDHLLWATFCA